MEVVSQLQSEVEDVHFVIGEDKPLELGEVSCAWIRLSRLVLLLYELVIAVKVDIKRAQSIIVWDIVKIID